MFNCLIYEASIPSILIQQFSRVGIIIIRTTYGYDVKSADDPILAQPLLALDNFAKTAAPGNFFVDFLPWRKSLSIPDVNSA